MIDLYYWTTPNGHKITMFLEEAGLEYRIKPVNIGKGEQFDPAFLEISPNNRIPRSSTTRPPTAASPSACSNRAILLYLAGKTGSSSRRSLPRPGRDLEWLMWQMGGLWAHGGAEPPLRALRAREACPYAIERYVKETIAPLRVLDKRLKGRDFISGKQYTIADMAPTLGSSPSAGADIDDFPNLKRWKAGDSAHARDRGA
jgi:GST-like protein